MCFPAKGFGFEMKLFLHDYGGYAFTRQLAREMARRGHVVRYVYCSSLTNTPLAGSGEADVPRLSVRALDVGQAIAKYSYVTRWRQERAYSRLLAADVTRFRPDVVLSANAPLDVQNMLVGLSRKQSWGFVYWLQDMLGQATRYVLSDRLGAVGAAIGSYYERLERRLVADSNHVIPICEAFSHTLNDWGMPEAHYTVMHNWAPLDEIPVVDRDNSWALEQGLSDGVRFVYAGNLGLKHRPHLLADLAQRLTGRRRGEVIVVSQGQGAAWLETESRLRPISNLRVLPFQPNHRFAEVLGAADVLVSVLGKEAGSYSVPSKVLSYMCAGRAILMAAPVTNDAARLVSRSGAGTVVDSDDQASFLQAADKLLCDEQLRASAGRLARTYAESEFSISSVAATFERILQAART